MCGRYSNRMSWREMVERYRATDSPPPNTWSPRYNIAPTQNAPVVRLDGDGNRELRLIRWSLVPSWSKGPDSRYSMINARAETVREKPASHSAFKSRRCLVPATGFYEWKKTGDGKQPYHIGLRDDEPFAFAGLWVHWEPEDDSEPIDSFTIVVTDANDFLRPIHDRMPVILDPDDYDTWLMDAPDDAAALLRPYPPDGMDAWPVSRRVNSPKNDDPSLLAPVELAWTPGC